MVFLPKKSYLKLILIMKIRQTPNEELSQNNEPLSVRVMKVMKRLKNSIRLKETNET